MRDFDRPLTDKGRAQSEVLRAWAKDPESLGRYGPCTALVSSSARTRETYAVGFAGTAFVHALETSELIYNGQRDVSADDLLAQLAEIDPGTESLVVIAHNPTVFEVAQAVSDRPIPALAKAKYPLAAALVFRLHDGETVGLTRYEFVESFVPEV